MGCWNHTDMLSQLHILAGEEVVSLFLVAEYQGRSLCYSTCYYSPIPILLYGKYNDYGAVEDFTGKFDHILIDYLKKHVVALDQGENEYHDIPVNANLLNIDFLYEADHEDRLKVKGYKAEPLSCRHVVIKKSLFDKILEEFYIETYESIDGKYCEKRIYFKDVCENIEEQTKIVLDIISLEPSWFRPETAFWEYTRWGKDKSKHIPILDYLPVRNNHDGPVDIYFFEILKTMVGNGNPQEEIVDFVREYAKFMWLYYYVEQSRKIWIPQGGQGSQNQETLCYEIMGQYLLDETAREKVQMASDWED